MRKSQCGPKPDNPTKYIKHDLVSNAVTPYEIKPTVLNVMPRLTSNYLCTQQPWSCVKHRHPGIRSNSRWQPWFGLCCSSPQKRRYPAIWLVNIQCQGSTDSRVFAHHVVRYLLRTVESLTLYSQFSRKRHWYGFKSAKVYWQVLSVKGKGRKQFGAGRDVREMLI